MGRKRVLGWTVGILAVPALGVAAIWLMVRDDVVRLRSTPASTTPAILRAIIAAEDPVLEPPRLSVRSLLPRPRNTVSCGPSHIAYKLVRALSPPRHSRFETAVTSYVVSQLYAPEELLGMYAHVVYLGKVDGREIRGFEAASHAYFGKPARDLSVPEAATIAAIIPAPNAFSPLKHPERARERRDRVLRRMVR